MKLSKLIKTQDPCDGLPLIGRDGYAGEQDGSRAVLSGPHHFASRADADRQFPTGVPEYVRLHWAEFTPFFGWECVFGWWSDQPKATSVNPLIGD